MDPQNTTLHNSPARHDKVIEPLSQPTSKEDNPAIGLIRQKLDQLYSKEPDAKEEKQEVETLNHRSKHQKFMYELSHSGRSLAEIQTEWHNYYTALPDSEKHQVWHEFYAAHGHSFPSSPQPTPRPSAPKEPEHAQPTARIVADRPVKSYHQKVDPRTAAEVKDQLLSKVAKRARHTTNTHVQSLVFGFSSGLVVILILLFGFFNERFIAPFMTPSRAVSSTPIIIDPNNTAVGPESEIVIPKINVEIPVVYDEPSIEEHQIQSALERGVVHYATTSNPGEKGNGVIFGHSANNILNKGKYKFAFVLLKRLEPGDTFYIHKDGKRYVYKIFEKKIVPPTDVSVLEASDKPATFTLITCDPPGTNINRLVVVAEQISPDPGSNVASSAKQESANAPANLPGDAPTLWSRIKAWFQ